MLFKIADNVERSTWRNTISVANNNCSYSILNVFAADLAFEYHVRSHVYMVVWRRHWRVSDPDARAAEREHARLHVLTTNQ
jgi:hypothetical protein